MAYYFTDEAGNIRITPLVDHVARGRCSGFPECCIKYYCEVIEGGEQGVACDWGYRACPECIRTGNRVEVKHCAKNDGENCTCGTWANSIIQV